MRGADGPADLLLGPAHLLQHLLPLVTVFRHGLLASSRRNGSSERSGYVGYVTDDRNQRRQRVFHTG